VKCSNKILERWAKAQQYKSLKQERAHKTNKLSFWSLSLSLSLSLSPSLQGGPRASERARKFPARNAGLRDEGSKAGRSWRCTDSEQASERARARGPTEKPNLHRQFGQFHPQCAWLWMGFVCGSQDSFIHWWNIHTPHIYIYIKW
jgi:hypothetical protein